jgi:NADPH2:quinone reductase
MKAVLCKSYGPPESLVIEDVEPLKPDKRQVVVSVKACSVNFPDVLLIQGKYQFRPPLPFSPGCEAAGIVKEVGEGVQHVKPGMRVVAYTGWGGFAEEVVVDAARLLPLPDGMDFRSASAFVLTYGTAIHALVDRAQLQAGEKLLVLGAAGGVGLACVELGKLMGARVIAAASSDEKLAVCKEYGAEEVINYSTQDLRERIKALTHGQGVDVTFDPVGGDYSEAALRSMAWKGRHLVIGFAAGDIPRVPLNLTLLKGCSIVGVFWGSFVERERERNREHMHTLLRWFEEGKLKPHISAVYPLTQAAQALNDMLNRNVRGKVVIVVDEQ